VITTFINLDSTQVARPVSPAGPFFVVRACYGARRDGGVTAAWRFAARAQRLLL
jgi:hypothetical protein